MRPSLKRAAARFAAAATATVTTAAGLVVVASAPAQAKVVVTDYGFQSSAYGTRVTSNTIALNMGRTAFAWIACTRRAGLDPSNHPNAGNYLVESASPQNPWVRLGAVTSDNRTFRDARRGVVGSRAVNRIADLTLSGPSPSEGVPGPSFSLEGLTTQARVWADDGRLHGDTLLDVADLSLVLPEGTPSTGPLQQLIGAVDEGLGAVTDLLEEVNGNAIEVPGLGVIRLGKERVVEKRGFASAYAVALVVDLAGADATTGTVDDSRITIGRSRARINRGLPAGVMGGHAYPLQLTAADQLVNIGKVGVQTLPCQGTGGEVMGTHLPAQDVLEGALELGSLTAEAFGEQRQDRSGEAWTLGRVARVAFGSGDQRVELRGIVGVARVQRQRDGDVLRSSRGTSVGSILVGGEEHALPDPGEPLEVPGVAVVEFGLTDKSARGLSVTAVRITLDPGGPAETVVNLGNARASIKNA